MILHLTIGSPPRTSTPKAVQFCSPITPPLGKRDEAKKLGAHYAVNHASRGSPENRGSRDFIISTVDAGLDWQTILSLSSQIFRAAGDSCRRSNLNAVVDIFAYSRE